MIEKAQQYFKQNNYVSVKNFISQDLANFLYTYAITKVKQIDFKKTHATDSYDKEWDGSFGDIQIPNSFYYYGDPVMESLLIGIADKVSQYTGKNLVPTYTYWRLYQHGDVLKRHRDRESCEYSATLCLGSNVSNVDPNEHPNYSWPIFVESNQIDGLDGVPIAQNPGDILIYKGTDVDHWRDEFKGLNHAQVFLHFNDSSGPYNLQYDGRPIIGIPKHFQTSI